MGRTGSTPHAAGTAPAERRVAARPSVLLRGIDWEGYTKLLELIGERHVRVNYDSGDAEIQGPPTTEGGGVLLRDIGWDGYSALLELIGERHVRVNYDGGDAELMAPLSIHEIYKGRLGLIVEVVTEELDIPRFDLGSATFRRDDAAKGLEPDECYYFGDLDRIPEHIDRNTVIEAPPDLAIEVDVTSDSRKRLGIYSVLGVPEVWRCNGTRIRVLVRRPDGTYAESDQSPLFPYLPMQEVERWVLRTEARDLVRWTRSLRAWVRAEVLPAYREWERGQGGAD